MTTAISPHSRIVGCPTLRGSAGTHATTELLNEDLTRNVRHLFKNRKPEAPTVAEVEIHCRFGAGICCDCGCKFDRTGVRHKRCTECKVLEHRKRNARDKARRKAHRESIGQGRSGK